MGDFYMNSQWNKITQDIPNHEHELSLLQELQHLNPYFCSTLEITWNCIIVPKAQEYPKVPACPSLLKGVLWFLHRNSAQSLGTNLQFRQESECFSFNPWLDRDTFAPGAASLPLHNTNASYSDGSVRCFGWREGGAVGHRITKLLCFGLGAIPCRSLGLDDLRWVDG